MLMCLVWSNRSYIDLYRCGLLYINMWFLGMLGEDLYLKILSGAGVHTYIYIIFYL